MLNHLTFAKLADLAEGRLSSNEQEASSSHLSTCSRCTAKLASLNSVVGLMRTDRAEDAPPELVARAINLFRSRAATRPPSLVKRIVAALSFDSLQMSPAFGVRSGQSSARQLLFVAGEYDLDLRITQSGETWNVSGQVFGEECVGGKIELEGETAIRVDLNNQCEFTMAAVPAGSYQLRLRLPDLEVEIPQLELRA
jgi:anti-sigma factor RsiW